METPARKVRARFAPSPTGPLHVGGVRTALFNYLFARKHGGDCILRIEDTDQTRYVPGAEDYITEALSWMGVEFDYSPAKGGPDAPYRQSERKPIYRQYAEQLVASGHAYYAFDTAEELTAMRERMEKSGMKSPQYNSITRQHMKNSLTLPADEVQKRLESGENYVIRIQLPRNEEIRFKDLIRGFVTFNTKELDDKVLLKSDGMPTYHLANIVDDHLMEITHVIRGEEWLPSAPLHVFMYRSFGWFEPEFAHLPLLLSPDGNGKLSKRDGDKYGFPVFPINWLNRETGETFSGYRESGYLPHAFANFLALLGWNPGTEQEIFTMDELIQAFSIERIGKSGVKFDKQKSVWFNHYYIQHSDNAVLLPYLKEQLAKEGISSPSDEYSLKAIGLVKEKVNYLTELLAETRYCFVAPTSYDEATLTKNWNETTAAFFQKVNNLFGELADWDAHSIETIFKAEVEAAGLKIGQAMPVFRQILTGVKQGPTVFDIAAVLGKTETLARFSAFFEKK